MVSILDSPFSCLLDGAVSVLFPEIGDLLFQRVVKVGCREQSLNGKEH
jgi:hypothetical protein